MVAAAKVLKARKKQEKNTVRAKVGGCVDMWRDSDEG